MFLAAEVFGKEHLIFLSIWITICVVSSVLAKLYLKTEKAQWIYIRILACLVLLFNGLTRVGIYIHGANWMAAVFPDTFCSMSATIFPILILFGKKDLYSYHGLWYLSAVGGLTSTIYPPYIGQGPTIWYLNTISGMIYHSLLTLLCFMLVLFDVFKPSIKKSFAFPIVFSLYIVFGAFLISKMGFSDAMCIRNPLLFGTPLDCWFILVVGTILVYLAAISYEYIPNLIKKSKDKKQSKEAGD